MNLVFLADWMLLEDSVLFVNLLEEVSKAESLASGVGVPELNMEVDLELAITKGL